VLNQIFLYLEKGIVVVDKTSQWLKVNKLEIIQYKLKENLLFFDLFLKFLLNVKKMKEKYQYENEIQLKIGYFERNGFYVKLFKQQVENHLIKNKIEYLYI
jgi:hypothetical protein